MLDPIRRQHDSGEEAPVLGLELLVDDARQLAELDQYERSSPLIRSHAESVLALVLWREADMDGALHHFHAAVRLAHESSAADKIAWAHLHLFRCLIDGHPNNAALAMLPDIRRLVTRAADPQITAYLHSCVAVLAGQIGQLDEARRHCDLAESLLEKARCKEEPGAPRSTEVAPKLEKPERLSLRVVEATETMLSWV